MCTSVTLAASGNIKVAVTADPGATDFNVYLAQNGSCTGLTYCDHTNGSSSVTISSCPTGQPSPPDWEAVPLAAGLPNADPTRGPAPRGVPPHQGHFGGLATGHSVRCPGLWVPGPGTLFIPSAVC